MSQKLFSAILILVLIAAVIAGITVLRRMQPAEEESSAEIQQATEALVIPSEIPGRISFEVPSMFEETSSRYYDKYYVCNDASIIITGEEIQFYGVTLDDYAKNVRSQYEDTADSFRIISEESVKINDQDCRLIEFTYAINGSSESLTMQCMTAIFLSEEESFILTCKSHADSFQNYRAAFSRAIESVKITSKSGESLPPQETALTFPPLQDSETMPQKQTDPA